VHLIAQADAALSRNWRTVLWYTLASLIAITLHGLVLKDVGASLPEGDGPKPLWAVLVTLGVDLMLVAIIAALQSVAFGLIGGEMDRPLWKFGTPQESLRRFYSYWFILSLLSITAARLPVAFSGDAQLNTAIIMEMLHFQLIIFGVPFGACIMHGGGLRWREIPALLAPCHRLFLQAIVAFGLGALQCIVILLAASSASKELWENAWYRAAVSLPLILLELLAFTVMWLVCIQYRDVAPEVEDDDDFDF